MKDVIILIILWHDHSVSEQNTSLIIYKYKDGTLSCDLQGGHVVKVFDDVVLARAGMH